MNILFLTSTLPRFNNDSQAPFVLEQASAWKDIRPEDEIYILAPHDSMAKRTEQLEGIKIYRFRYWWPEKWQLLAYPAIMPNIKKNPLLFIQLFPFFLSELLMALLLIRKNRIDLIYAHWVIPQGLIGYALNKLLGISYILQNHSSDLRVCRKLPLAGKLLARKVIENSRKLFCVNALLKKEALDFFNESSRDRISEKIKVLPMGVDYSFVDQHTEKTVSCRYSFGLIGRLSKKKGADLLIKTLKLLKEQNIHYNAVIAGDGEERAKLQELAHGNDIEFPGFITEEKKIRLFEQTKYFVFPSYPAKGDIEGLPVALLEALCVGKIVVASRSTNIELLPEWEYVKDEIFLLDDPFNINDFADILKNLLNLKEEKVIITSKKLRKFFERYKWNNLIKEYLSFIGIK
jgi:glycosyltransferase involved in cell wall biosynthesis